MKRLLTLVTLLALSVCMLAGCSKSNETETPEIPEENAWLTYEANFNAEQTTAMSNYMAGGMYLIEDNIMYGLSNEQNLNGFFAAMPFEMVGDFPEFGEITILDDRGVAYYICRNSDYLYYILDYAEVCRVKIDGTERETLYEGACDYLQLHNNMLYFTNEDYQYVSMALDGGQVTTVVDRAIFYPYFICEDWMIFQDDANSESLHLRDVKQGTDVNITQTVSYHPILDESYLYFMDGSTDPAHFCRVDISNPENFVIEAGEGTLINIFNIDEEFIYASNNTSVTKENWYKLNDAETVLQQREMYQSASYAIHHELDAEGLITAKYLFSKEQHGGTSFA